MPPAVSLFAVTTRGLERVVAHELAALPGVVVTQMAYRRVLARSHPALGQLLTLRTADDLFLTLGCWQGIGRARTALDRLSALGAGLRLDTAAARCAAVRPLRSPPVFSVSASFVGTRNYTAAEIKAALARGIRGRYPWPYTDDDRCADVNIRIMIEHECALVGMRLGKSPLHARPWQRAHRPGALKPSVAAAMLALTASRSGMCVLDPCCGAGTIAIEAALGGLQVVGGDIDAGALAATQTNADAACVAMTLCRMDARQAPFADASIDRIVVNVPWGRQVSVAPTPATFTARLLDEIGRVLKPGGRLGILTNRPDLIATPGLKRMSATEISLSGQTPTLLVVRKQG